MIEQIGKVVATTDGVAWVQTIQQSACASCAASKGCGAAVLEKIPLGKTMQMPVVDRLGVRVGDSVVIGIPDDALLKASFVVYFLPLLLMLALAVAAGRLWPGVEVYSILSGLIGLLAGFALARWISGLDYIARRAQPVMLRKVAEPVAMLAQACGAITNR
jgi:sigma-E factor negative regulatory protein RseC